MPVERLCLPLRGGGRNLPADDIADDGGNDDATRCDFYRKQTAENRTAEDGDVRSCLDQPRAGEHFVLFQMLWQDRVFDRPEKCRLDTGQEQREQQDHDGPARLQRREAERDIDRQGIAAPRKVQTERPDQHQPDLAEFHGPDDCRLVAQVRQLSGQCRKHEERQDEQARRDRAERAFRAFRIVDAVDDEQHHRVLVQIVVERVEQLRHEQRQEPAHAQQVGRGRHGCDVRDATSDGIMRLGYDLGASVDKD